MTQSEVRQMFVRNNPGIRINGYGGYWYRCAHCGNAGKLIVINHGDGKVTKYMHCNAMYVSAGQKVSKGQHIAAVGTTGNSTGPHLHFQLEIGGVPKNPVNYY